MTTWFAQNAVIQATAPGGTQPETVGVVQEVRIETQVEVTKLYGFGSIKRLGEARHTLTNSVTVNFASFTAEFGDWFWKIMNEAGPTGTTGAKTITYSDTTKVPLFQITGLFTGDDGTSQIYATAIDTYFANLPFGGALGEYVFMNLTGEARDVQFSQTAPSS